MIIMITVRHHISYTGRYVTSKLRSRLINSYSSPRLCTNAIKPVNNIDNINLSEPSRWQSLMPFTGKRVNITWDEGYQPINSASERKLMTALLMSGEYQSGKLLSPARIKQINEASVTANMTIDQCLSLRKQLLVDKVVRCFLTPQMQATATKAYNSGKDISVISRELDIPAMKIFRAIVAQRLDKLYPSLTEKEVKNVIKWAFRFGNSSTASLVKGCTVEINNINITLPLSLFGGDGAQAIVLQTLNDPVFWQRIINSRDVDQMIVAKAIDQTTFSEDFVGERLASLSWENSLYDFLDKHNVSYIKEDELMKIPNCFVTPDAVILDDCYINGKLVQWIDCKCFYGSYSAKPFISNLLKQVHRYNNEIGKGCLIYRLGYSAELAQELMKNDVVMLSMGPLVDFSTYFDY